MRIMLAIFFMLPLLFSQSESQIPKLTDQLNGTWEGSINILGSELRLVFNLNKSKDGSFTGTMDSPDQGARDIPITNILIDTAKIQLQVASIAGAFLGIFKPEDNLIEGNWIQGGTPWPLILKPKTPDSKSIKDSQIFTKEEQEIISGTWEGTLEIPQGNLRIVFNISFDHIGIPSVTFDSPDQGAFAIPATSVSYREEKLRIGIKSINGAFMGKINQNKNQFDGNWYQLKQITPLNIKQVSQKSELRRPQTPQKPYPYIEEHVRFKNVFANISLAGSLTLPDSVGSYPAVLLVSGSGPQNRDEFILGHSPFLVLADYLTRQGIAVLRYDDRGVGESEGNFSTATTIDFANDAYAAIHYLKTRKEINHEMIGIIGHSEGGIVAPMVANRVPELAFIVLIAGPGLTGEEILYHQIEILLKATGENEQLIDFIKQLTQNTYEIIKEEPDNKIAEYKLLLLYEKTWNDIDEDLKLQMEKRGETKHSIKNKIPSLLSPWFRNFLIYNPIPALTKVKCSVLAINGEKDMQVPADENLMVIKNALLKGGNKDIATKKLEGLNHLLQTAETGLPAEYGKIEETMSPDAMALISEWILDHVESNSN